MNARYVSYVKSNSCRGKSYSAIVEADITTRKRLARKKLHTATEAIQYGQRLAARYNRYFKSVKSPR